MQSMEELKTIENIQINFLKSGKSMQNVLYGGTRHTLFNFER